MLRILLAAALTVVGAFSAFSLYNDYFQRQATRSEIERYLANVGSATSDGIRNWLGGRVALNQSVAQGVANFGEISQVMSLLHDPNAIDALRFGTRISFRWVATSKPRRSRLSGPPARQW